MTFVILRTSFCDTLFDWDDAKYLSKTIHGMIGGGNFTYYSLKCHGICKVELKSLSGDADLYVSEKVERPTWEEYDFKADTCGLDVIGVSSEKTRQIFLGVYGHPFFDESRFALSVYVDSESYSSRRPGKKSPESSSIPALVLEILFELLKIVAEILL